MNHFQIRLPHAAAIMVAFVLTSVLTNLSAQTPSAVDMPTRATKERLIERAPDYSYSVTDGETSNARQAQLSDLVPDAWDIHHQMVQGRDADVNPKPPMTPEAIARLQAKLAYRQQLESQGDPSGGLENVQSPGHPIEYIPTQSSSSAINPEVGVEVQSTYNAPNSQVPDGAAAVNGAGKIVVANNTHIEMYDEDGTQLYSQSEGTFWSPLSPTANIYDPRIEYDTFNNRFIIVELHGSQPTLTQIYIAVSKTSNPESGWWFYEFNANQGDSDLWFDYPKIGYSEETLTVSGNMFTATGTGATESKVYLFELYDAYAGLDVSSWYFDDVEAGALGWNEFSIKPCSYPFGIYGPGLYMIGRDDADDIAWWDISANAGDDPTMNGWIVDVGSINNPVDAPQPGGPALGVAPRLQSAYVDISGDDKIHFTYAISDDNGDNRIFLGRLNTANENVVSENFGVAGKDYAYPWIMPWTTNSGAWNGGSLVAFLRVSSTINPQFRIVHGYPNSTDWGGSILVKAGESAIGAGNRWGDYIGGGFREGQSDPECWVYGQYGLNNDHGVWLAQITLHVEGCMDPQACNYNSLATDDDGTCEYDSCAGCTDPDACNYNSNADIDDDSCTYPGCTDWFACNYQFGAGCSDGSCCYDTCIDLEMPLGIYIPTFGINTMLYYTLSDNNSGADIESGNNSSGSVKFCLDPGCYHMDITGENVSWTLALDPVLIFIGADYTIETGTGPSSFDFIVGDGGEMAGCMDDAACNYDDTALCDNNTCCYSSCVTVAMTDSYGDGWNNNTWEIRNDNNLVTSGTLEVGYSGSDLACLDPGCYNFSVNSEAGMYSYEIGWTLNGLDETVSGNYLTEAEFTVAGGGSDVGCIDNEACNFDENAICDDGSCCYDNCCTLTMNDSYGDGWQGAQLSITGNGDSSAYSMADGFTESVLLCLPDGCFDIEVSDDQYDYEVSWELMCPNVLLGGGSNFDHMLTLNEVNGCTDSLACNYDVLANCDDGCCEYPGCMDPQACDYNECANCSGNVICDFSCQGCTYEVASNYNPESTMDDGSCEFIIAPPESTCAADINGDGSVSVMDLLLVLEEFGNDCVDPGSE